MLLSGYQVLENEKKPDMVKEIRLICLTTIEGKRKFKKFKFTPDINIDFNEHNRFFDYLLDAKLEITIDHDHKNRTIIILKTKTTYTSFPVTEIETDF